MKDKTKRVLRRMLLLGIDAVLLYACTLLTSFVLFSNLLFITSRHYAVFGLIAVQILLFIAFRLYYIRILDSSLELVLRGVGSITIFILILFFALLRYFKDFEFAFRFTTVFAALSTVVVLGYRIAYRIIISYNVRGYSANGYSRTIVYGAGDVGVQLSRQFYKKRLPFHLLGFIDDDPEKQSAIVGGLTVLGNLNSLSEVLRTTAAETLIFAITDLSSQNMRKALEIAEKFGVETKIIPSLFELEAGRKSVADIRAINVDDLLGRSPISFDKTPIEQMVRGKRVLVTGAGGSIGSEISRQLTAYKPEQLLLLDIDETELHDLSLRLHEYQAEFSNEIVPIVCDVRNENKIERIFATYKPQIVFHAAAYKHVPMMEYYPEEAFKTNVVGSYHLFSAAVRHKSERCIFISTDKAVNPTNVMGATKRVAEMIGSLLSSETTEIVCVRFGNVLGSRGSMLPLFLEQMREGYPITVTDKKVIRYFMTIREAVSLVSLAGALGKGREVMVLDMGEQVNIYDFATRLVRHFGDERSNIVITGLRPGEKLYEEKLSDKDKTIPTDNPKVFKAIVNDTLDRENFDEILNSMENLHSKAVVQLLQSLVPEFTYQENNILSDTL